MLPKLLSKASYKRATQLFSKRANNIQCLYIYIQYIWQLDIVIYSVTGCKTEAFSPVVSDFWTPLFCEIIHCCNIMFFQTQTTEHVMDIHSIRPAKLPKETKAVSRLTGLGLPQCCTDDRSLRKREICATETLQEARSSSAAFTCLKMRMRSTAQDMWHLQVELKDFSLSAQNATAKPEPVFYFISSQSKIQCNCVFF